MVPPKTTTSADPQRSSRSIALNSHAVGPNPVAKMGSSRCSESRTRAPQGSHQRPSLSQVSDAPCDGKASLPGSAKSPHIHDLLKGKSPFRRLSLPSWSFPDEHVLFQQSQCWVAIGKADLGSAGVGPNTPDRNRSGGRRGRFCPNASNLHLVWRDLPPSELTVPNPHRSCHAGRASLGLCVGAVLCLTRCHHQRAFTTLPNMSWLHLLRLTY